MASSCLSTRGETESLSPMGRRASKHPFGLPTSVPVSRESGSGGFVRPGAESPSPFQFEHVVAGHGKRRIFLCQLDLEHALAVMPEGHFRSSEVEFPHAAEAFVVEQRGFRPVLAEFLAPGL